MKWREVGGCSLETNRFPGGEGQAAHSPQAPTKVTATMPVPRAGEQMTVRPSPAGIPGTQSTGTETLTEGQRDPETLSLGGRQIPKDRHADKPPQNTHTRPCTHTHKRMYSEVPSGKTNPETLRGDTMTTSLSSLPSFLFPPSPGLASCHTEPGGTCLYQALSQPL